MNNKTQHIRRWRQLTVLMICFTLLYFPFLNLKAAGPGSLTPLHERGIIKGDHGEILSETSFYAASSSVYYMTSLIDFIMLPLHFKTLNVDITVLDTSAKNSSALREERIEQSGIHYRDHVYQVVQQHTERDLSFEDIDFNTFRGSSAGLMLSLHLIQETDGLYDLTSTKIVGTGAIDGEGNVMKVGSIKEKIHTAHMYGADLFLVPSGENEDTAHKAAEMLNATFPIIGIGHITEALQFLDEHHSVVFEEQ